MYKHSYRPEGPWQGQFTKPQQALDNGRAVYGDVTRVWVGRLETAYFADLFIGSKALWSYMREESEDMGDSFTNSLDAMPVAQLDKLGAYLYEALGEWEADLPENLQCGGEIVKTMKGYPADAMVRKADFADGS